MIKKKVNRLFVFVFESLTDRKTSFSNNYLPKEIIAINGITFLDKWVRNNKQIFEDIIKFTNGYYDILCCLLDYSWLNEHYRWIVLDLSKPQVFDTKIIQ